MCLAVPAIVVKVEGDIAYIDVGDGIKRPVLIGITEEKIKEGDVVLVHAGVIISKVDFDKMREVFELYKQLEETLRREVESGLESQNQNLS